MVVKAWVAAHTGLPSIYSDTAVRVTCGDRVLADGSGPVLLSDALAEPGVATTYTVGSETVTLTRRDDGHMLTNARGRGRVSLAWLGDDEDEWDPRISMFDPSGVRSPVSRWSLRPSTPTGTLNARTLADQTQAMRDLVGADHRGPVIAIHSQRECQVPECDIPPVRMVVLGEARSQRSARVDVAARSWSLPYRAVDPRETRSSGVAPVITWGEWQALGDAAREKYGDMIFRNLVQNGRAAYTSGTVEVRRNIFPDPRGTNAAGWSTSLGDVSSITDFPGDIATAQRHTRTSGGVAAFRSIIPTLAASTTYAVRLKVRASAVTAGFGLHLRPNMGVPTAQTTVVSNQTLQIGVTEFTAVVTTSDTAVTAPGFAAVWSGGTTGDTIDMTAVLISPSTVMGGYFDGSHSPDPDLTPSWTGAENASPSVLTGVVTTGLPSLPNTFAVQSTQWPDNGTSVRLIPMTGARDTYVPVNGDTGAMRLGMVAGRPTAVRARGYLPNPQTGELSTDRARNVTLWMRTSGASSYTSTNGTQPPNVQGEFISEVVTTLPADATEAFVRLYNGASVGNGEVYWTDIIVAQADTEAEALSAVRTYFDGDGADDPLLAASWDGPPGQASSTAKAAVGWQHHSALDLCRRIAGMPA